MSAKELYHVGAQAEERKSKQLPLTINGEAGLVGVGGAEVVGDDALVAALVREGDVPQVQDGGALHHLPVLGPHVREVLDLGVVQHLVVLLPGKHHGGAAAAGGQAGEADVLAKDSHRRLGLDDDLWLGEIIWEGTAAIVSAGI